MPEDSCNELRAQWREALAAWKEAQRKVATWQARLRDVHDGRYEEKEMQLQMALEYLQLAWVRCQEAWFNYSQCQDKVISRKR